TIYFRKKTMPLGGEFLERMGDYILWYSKDREAAKAKFRRLYLELDTAGDFHWDNVELPTGERVPRAGATGQVGRAYRLVSLWPPTFSEAGVFEVSFRGKVVSPPKGQCWPTNPEGMRRLAAAERLEIEGSHPRYVLKADDYPLTKLTPIWNDT